MKELTKSRIDAVESSLDAYDEFSKLAVVGIGTAAVIVGGWAVACFANGIIVVGGPFGLVLEWFRAVIG